MNRFRQTTLLSAFLVAALRVSASPCPPLMASPQTVIATPALPKIGDQILVTINEKIDGHAIVCVDDNALDASAVTQTITEKEVSIKFDLPGDPKSAKLTGVHTIKVLATGADGRQNAYKAEIGKAPELDAVTSELAPDGTLIVKLKGRDFDAVNQKFNSIQVNNEDLEVCWVNTSPVSAEPLSGCAPSVVGGYVTPTGDAIELTRINPLLERTASFKVFINGSASQDQKDSEVTIQRAWAYTASTAATLAMVVIVIVLVYKYLRPTFIGGDSYIVRALFMDKETNTYSLSKFQFYVWTIVAVFGYVYLAIAKNWFQHVYGLPPLPPGLPGIVGLAAGTAVGAQVVTNVNGPKGAGQPAPTLADFVTTGEVVAAERVQFFVWTIIGAVGYLLVIMALDPRVLKDLPEVPSSMLAISGISALGYLGGKLARDPGPVITETMASIGPDPDAGTPAPGTPTTPTAAPARQVSAAITTAQTQITSIRQSVQSIASKAPTQAVIAAANQSCDAATAAIQAAQSGGDAATVLSKVQQSANAADAAAREAATATTTLPKDTAKSDLDDANKAAAAAQQAAAAAQALVTALQSGAGATAGGATSTTPASVGPFGRIELRGRMLSRDATFRVRTGEDTDANALNIPFDQLQPSPLPNSDHLKKPRVVERDTDSTDPTMAKRLLMVINLKDDFRPLFNPGSTHTITVTNPDSQKAVFKFQVPSS